MDKDEAKLKVEEKAEERVTLTRKEWWYLKIAAATGIMSFISHGISAVTWVVSHVHL
jgi:hypothetical protein